MENTTFPKEVTVNGLSRDYKVTVKTKEEANALQVTINLSYNNSICRKTGSYCGGNCSEYDCWGH